MKVVSHLPPQGLGSLYETRLSLLLMLLLRGGRVAQLQLAVLLLWFVVAEPGCGAAV